MTESPIPANDSLRTDEPITNEDEDQLERGPLVDVIARHIQATKTSEGVVLALNAPWGAGKSSFINLLEQKLTETRAESLGMPPLIVHFNPWHYTNVEQVVRMFFSELERGIGVADLKEAGKQAGELLRLAGSIVGAVHSGAGGAIKDFAGALTAEQSLPVIKQELNQLLSGLGQRVVVFIDDIDRLERDTLRMLFKVIRLNAGFSNITYVLAFDRSVVERSLDEENGIRGRDYLEKIIQVSFDIPEPEPVALQGMLFREMDAVLEGLKTRQFDESRWGNLFHSGFKEHFRTIRNIKRYVNGLRLTLAPVAQEVDVVDFLGIELLRVFHPEVYSGLSQGKDTLLPEPSALREVPTERLREWIEGLAAKASPGFKDQVLELLKELFPQLARVYRNTTHSTGYYTAWRREGRVCSPEVFDKFFLLRVPTGEIAEVELRAFLDCLVDVDATVRALELARESAKARRLLERLEDFTSEFNQYQAKVLITALFELGDGLRFKSRGMFDFSADMQVPRLLYRCLSRIKTEVERKDILLPLIRTGKGLYTLFQEVSLLTPKEDDDTRLSSTQQVWEELRDEAVNRIQEADASGALWQLQQLVYVLYRWMEWTSEEEVKQAVERHVVDDTHLLQFVSAFVSESHSYSEGDKVSRTHRRLNKKNLAMFVSIEEISSRLERLVAGGSEVAGLAQSLLELLQIKSDSPWDE